MSVAGHGMRVRGAAFFLALGLAGCPADPIIPEGEFDRPIPLVSGDGSPLPRLVFIDEGCPGSDAIGGCGTGARACEQILIDTLAPLTAIQRDDDGDGVDFGRECLEVREARGLAADPVQDMALENAVTRFRFRELPLLRAPAAGTSDWDWDAGDQNLMVSPSGVMGGNLLREFALLFRTPAMGSPALAIFKEFPGGEGDLADQGRAFLPVQFPGRLLGKDLGDRCDIDGNDCDLEGFDLQGRPNVALGSTRIVMDACLSVPPCGVQYAIDPLDPFAAGTCTASRGPDDPTLCVDATDEVLGGEPASLVLATGAPDLVLFSDSASRMFGDVASLPACDSVDDTVRACLAGQDGVLALSGWPTAGIDEPLPRLLVRSFAILPGLTQTSGNGPCARADRRRSALFRQCKRFVDDFVDEGNLEDTTPPYSGSNDNSDGNDHENDRSANGLAVLGEVLYGPEQTEPDTMRWIPTLVLPEIHPLVLSLRRDVAPEARQPDGLIGTALFRDTSAVIDYTDPNPGLRVQCLTPHAGDCLAAPECREDAQAACCFGLPLNLLVEFIVLGRDDTCCRALSASDLSEIQGLGACRGVSPP